MVEKRQGVKNLEYKASSLSERRKFYEKEFSIKKVKAWFKKNNLRSPQICALDAGSESGIIINKKFKKILFYFPFEELKKKIEKYIPESIYYDRNYYLNPKKVLKNLKFENFEKQELVFDVDWDNLDYENGQEPKVADKYIDEAYKWVIKMKKALDKEGFKKIEIVYSGRGFHIHILDKKGFELSIKERKKLTKKFSGFPIDSWVSEGYINLARMPYSLNGLVSRKVIPIEIKNKFNKKLSYPRFLKSKKN